MGMTQEDREAFAARLNRAVRERFGGVAKSAYTAAGVNSATWSNAVNARPIKPHKQIEIVRNLWPETRGDWTQIPDVDAVEHEPDMGEQMRLILERQRQLEQRLAALERETDVG
jgi:hypothetical protein